MRYLMSARVRPERRGELLEAIESGTFGRGFPYGDLGETLCEGKVELPTMKRFGISQLWP